MPRPEVTAYPATAMHKAGGPRRPDAEQSPTQATAMHKAGGPRRPDAELSWQVTPCSCRTRCSCRPPSDGNAQGRWSAASRRGTKTAGHSLLMPHPEVTAHPATAMRKAGGPRRPDAELSWQDTRCSCRTRRSRPTQVAHAAPGGHGPPSDGNAQGRWSAASRRGTNTQRIRALRFTTVVWERDQSPIVHHNRFLKSKTQRIDWRLRLRVTTVERDSDGWLGRPASTLLQGW